VILGYQRDGFKSHVIAIQHCVHPAYILVAIKWRETHPQVRSAR
jgi:hypothetical protein